jgi:V8-like Glu-specific endopeptidase
MLRILIIPSVRLVLLLALLTLGYNAHAQTPLGDPAQDSRIITKRATKEEGRQILENWTNERMLAAKPMQLPHFQVEDVKAEGDLEAIGTPGFAEGGAPSPEANKAARAEFPAQWKDREEEVAVGVMEAVQGTPGVFDVYTAKYDQMRLQYPWKAIGFLISSEMSCTAAVMSPNNLIVTAAHCVYDTSSNTWYEDFAFVPARRYGSTYPYGVFPYRWAKILGGWKDASGLPSKYDVALLKLRKNAAGRPVTFYTGWLGYWYNAGSTQHIHSFGYGGNYDFGQSLTACESESYYGGRSYLMGMGCTLKFGASGGPWLRVFSPYEAGNKNYVTAVVSGGTSNNPNNYFGTRFTSDNIVALCGSLC